jgi:hypothetical protein
VRGTLVVPAPARDRTSRAGATLGWVRGRLLTTPGRLTLAAILVVAGAIVCGILTVAAERSVQRAPTAARRETEPLLVQAVTLYTKLSDANATATATFATGGLEPPARRAHYLADMRAAGGALVTLTREAGTSADARAAVLAITPQLPVYAGLVETARADNRQGLPVGAGYLRQASALLASTVLPAADRLYATEAERLNDVYESGTSTATIVAFTVAMAIALALLVALQIWLARLTHRVFNLAILLATIVLAAGSAFTLVGMVGAQHALARAQRDGSDPAEALSATRVLFSRAQTDESLILVNRGGDETDQADFDEVMRVLAPGRGANGLLGEVSELDRRSATSAAALVGDFAAYRALTDRIARLEAAGNTSAAIDAADGSSASDHVTAILDAQTAAAQRRFTRAAADATSSLSGLSLTLPLVIVIAAALGLLGLGQRLREYRR